MNDKLREGAENLTFTLANDSSKSAAVSVIYDSSEPDSTYVLSVDKTTVNEGDTANLTLQTTNISAGSVVDFTFNGSATAADLTSGYIPTSFTVGTDGKATIPLNFLKDTLTEGAENLTFALMNDVTKSVAINIINDTSPNHAPTLPITAIKLVDGKMSVAYSISKSMLLAGFNDIDGDLLSVTNLTVTNGTLTPSSDGWTFTPFTNYSGSVNLNYNVTDGKTDGTVIAQPINFNVPSPAKPPTYILSVNKNNVNEDETVTFSLATTNVDAGTKIPFKFDGAISSADVLKELPATNFVIQANGTASVPVTFLADKITDGEEILALTLLNDSTKSVSVHVQDSSPMDGIAKIGDANKNKLIGADKNDFLSGMAAADTLLGYAGNDSLDGGNGNDSLDGGNGNDTLIGGDGNDTLLGGSGNDLLDGGKDNDKLTGDAGNDTLNGGVGVDSLTGGDGNDYYVVDNVKDVVIEANKTAKTGGTDTVESTSNYTLGVNVENLILKDTQGKGNNGTGNVSNNTITGSDGDNWLKGMDGNDTLIGGNGADTLDGGSGMDALIGGADDDTYYMNNLQDKIIEAKDGGEDAIIATVDFELSTSPNVEMLTLSGTKAKNGTGNELDNLLQEIDGGKVSVNLKGMQGDDTINGGGGNDTLEGGDGNDILDGGDGNDMVIFTGAESDYQVTRNSDADNVDQIIVTYAGNDNSIQDGTDILTSIEILQFSEGDLLNTRDVIDSSAMVILTGVV